MARNTTFAPVIWDVTGTVDGAVITVRVTTRLDGYGAAFAAAEAVAPGIIVTSYRRTA